MNTQVEEHAHSTGFSSHRPGERAYSTEPGTGRSWVDYASLGSTDGATVMRRQGMAVEFRVLGDIEVLAHGHPVDIGPTKQRTLLAVLLAEAGRVVTVEQLASRLWDANPPKDPRDAVYSHLSRLRKLLPNPAVITNRGGGYLLDVALDTIDLHRFRRLVRQARTNANTAVAARLFDEALALWRGTAFNGVDSAGVEGLRTAVMREHLEAELDRNDAYLRMGEHSDLLARLQHGVQRFPLDERLHGQLMLALYRGGQQAAALDHYEALRRRLATELSCEPSPRLRGLHRDILTGDAALDSAPPPAVQRYAAETPKLLPAAPQHFSGRAQELARLDTAQQDNPIWIVSGIGGIGKTWLTLHWAHRNTASFPDGQLYLNLRGFEASAAPLAPADAIRILLDALGINRSRLPHDLDALIALYRSTIAGRRLLLLLDNARDSAQAEPLLPGTASCVTIVTSRSSMPGLSTSHGASRIRLDVFDDATARQTLLEHLDDDQVRHDAPVVDELLAHCGGFPLALGILASRASNYRHDPLTVLAEELRDEPTALDSLTTGDLDVSLRAVFTTSWRALSSAAGELFPALSLADGTDIPLEAAASLGGQPVGRTRTLLRELENTHLVEQHRRDRYRLHDLVRQFAAECLTTWDRDSRAAAARRLIDHYLHSGVNADHKLNAARVSVDIAAPAPGSVVRDIADESAATAWFHDSVAAFPQVQDLATRHGWHDRVWQLAWAATTYLRNIRADHTRIAMWEVACQAGEQLDDSHVLSYGHQQLGQTFSHVGEHDAGLREMRRSLEFALRTTDSHLQSRAHYCLGVAYERQARFQDAATELEQSLDLLRASDERANEVITVNGLGWVYAKLGELDKAEELLAEALRLSQLRDEASNAGDVHSSLAYVARRRGDLAAAERHYQDALDSYQRFDMVDNQITSLTGLARVHRRAGRPDAAWRTLGVAADLCHRIGLADKAQRLLRGEID